MDEATVRRLTPGIEERHFSNGKPYRYVRHKITRIDVSMLRRQMETAWEAYSNAKQTKPVVFPLFDGEFVEIEVNNWSLAQYGTQSAMGTLSLPADPTAHAWIRFRQRGELHGTIRTSSAIYEIKLVSEPPYYSVMEFDVPSEDQSMD